MRNKYSVDPCKVITLNLVCFIFGIIPLLLSFIFHSVNIALPTSCLTWSILEAIAKSEEKLIAINSNILEESKRLRATTFVIAKLEEL